MNGFLPRRPTTRHHGRLSLRPLSRPAMNSRLPHVLGAWAISDAACARDRLLVVDLLAVVQLVAGVLADMASSEPRLHDYPSGSDVPADPSPLKRQTRVILLARPCEPSLEAPHTDHPRAWRRRPLSYGADREHRHASPCVIPLGHVGCATMRGQVQDHFPVRRCLVGVANYDLRRRQLSDSARRPIRDQDGRVNSQRR